RDHRAGSAAPGRAPFRLRSTKGSGSEGKFVVPYSEGKAGVSREVGIAREGEPRGESRRFSERLLSDRAGPDQLALRLDEHDMLAGVEDGEFQSLRLLVEILSRRLLCNSCPIGSRMLQRLGEEQLLKQFRLLESRGIALQERQTGEQR